MSEDEKVFLPFAGRTPQRTSFHSKDSFTDFCPNASLDHILRGALAVKPSAEFNKAGTERYSTAAAWHFLAQ